MIKSAIRLILMLGFRFATLFSGNAGALVQQQSAANLLQAMTPEERVGQLFLVTFDGSEIYETDLIYELISQNHISGVIIKADRNNIISLPDTLPRLKSLVERLQNTSYNASLDATLEDPSTGAPKRHSGGPPPVEAGARRRPQRSRQLALGQPARRKRGRLSDRPRSPGRAGPRRNRICAFPDAGHLCAETSR